MNAALEKVEVRNRFTDKVQFTAEIECSPNASVAVKLGLAVRWARKKDANLHGADLSGADLSDANLRDANLGGADLSGADLGDCPVKIPNIHQTVFEAASQPNALDMGTWHCGTTHCRAGWVVTLAGEGGKALEYAMGTSAAATMIYMASDPKLEKVPNFYATNAEAMDDMRRLAKAEMAS